MSKQITVSDKVARPIRTAGQLVPAVVVADVIDAFVYDVSDRQYGVLIAALTILFGFLQTAYEDYKGKAFMRDMPPPEEVPVIDSEIEDVEGRHERDV